MSSPQAPYFAGGKGSYEDAAEKLESRLKSIQRELRRVESTLEQEDSDVEEIRFQFHRLADSIRRTGERFDPGLPKEGGTAP
jgi:multidrug resistance efflux pump